MKASPKPSVQCTWLRTAALLLAVLFAGIIGLSSRSVDLVGGQLADQTTGHHGEMAWQAPDHGLAAGPAGTNTPKPEEKEEDFRPEEKNDSKWALEAERYLTRCESQGIARKAPKLVVEGSLRTPKVPLYLLYGTHRGFDDRLV